jgi:hypothetical protein
MSRGHSALTPLHGFGKFGRTGAALIISNPRTKIGSQNRIYKFFQNLGEGQLYKHQLIDALGLQYLPRVNPWSMI